MGRDGKAFDYRDDFRYKEALEYAKGFKVQQGIDYRWVVDYAYKDYERLVDSAHRLEVKADDVIKYLGAFAGVMSIAGTFSASRPNVSWEIPAAVLPAFVLATLAICVAARVRIPTGVPSPPPAKDALRYAQKWGEQSEATFIPQVFAASEGLMAVIEQKARLVRMATRLFMWAVAALSLPLLATLVTAICSR